MSFQFTNASDSTNESKVAKAPDASAALIEAALTFYPCKNGALVKNPKECEGSIMFTPGGFVAIFGSTKHRGSND